MKPYVPTVRRFALAEKEELLDPDYLSYFGSEPSGVFKWPDLLKQAPVVVLGEGRSGKTREFEEQVSILRASGHFAFLVPLEILHDEELEDALSIEDLKSFEAWKGSPGAVGYFFMDALDELKLREGSLRKAMKKLQRACTPDFARLRLVLSCRPSDWKSQIDSQHLEAFTVRQNPVASKVEAVESEAAFLEVISNSETVRGQNPTKTEADDEKSKNLPTIVTLLSLSQNEIRQFSQSYSTENADEFCRHIEVNDLWHLYRLPAEIIDALDQMGADEPLGTLEDQLRLGIQRKLRELEANKRRALSADKALQGAERIALALFLLKRRTLRFEDTSDPDTLDVGDILTDWKPEEQQELIGKTLFDPSGVGSVRFHHRATQEYLAAKRIHQMRECGMNEQELFALLFCEIGGQRVVKPSMAPVAAWLALWHNDVRKIVLEREPGLLFRQGLPSALSLDIRAEVLRAYIPQYAGKGWCRAGVSHEQLRRVAHSSLGSVVRELWEKAYTGHDSRELLLELIWLAQLSDCSDLALAAAMHVELEPDHRIYASRGVLAAGSLDQKQTLAEAILKLTLPQRVIRHILPDMVPELIDTASFFALAEKLDVVPKSVHGLNYTIHQTIKNGKLSREAQITLRDRLAEAIWSTREDDCQMYQAHSTNDHFIDGLIACCSTTIPTANEDAAAWARALTIAVHFGDRDESIIAKTDTDDVWTAMGSNSKLREAYFWACLNMADKLDEYEDDWSMFIRVISETRRSIRHNQEDQYWLLNAVGPEAPENRRGVAFQAITYFFDLRHDSKLAECLAQRIGDRPEWLVSLRDILNPQPKQPNEWEVSKEIRTKKQNIKETKRVADWLEWRAKILMNAPNYLMDGDRRLDVLYDAKNIINQGINGNSSWGHWDSAIISRTLGDSFLERYRHELSIFWRETEVQLGSEQATEERNVTPASWLLALAAVKAEAETTGWATSLSHEEAVKATRIACIELNGFGGYIATLDKAHPQAVAHVVAEEAFAELEQLPSVGKAEMFYDVRHHGTENMKSAVAKRIVPHFKEFMSLEPGWGRNALEDAVQIVAMVGEPDAKEMVKEVLQEQLEQDSCLPKSFLLILLTSLDPEVGCCEVLKKTAQLNTSDDRKNAIRIIAAVFGDRHSRHAAELDAVPEDRRVHLLKNLVQRAYQAVRREEDAQHEGVFRPGLRDNAQDARSFLFSSLLSVKNLETLASLHELAKQPEFKHMSDRLGQMAYEIAAEMSDVTAHPLLVFKAMDRDGAFIPFDHRSLLTAMMTRLDSFEHDVLHAEDTPIEALRRLDQETDLRRFITNWLRGRDRDVFDFPQEAVVIKEKRPDIRFVPRSMNTYGTVELKRETWSVREFEKALKIQLVGQYLQHERCRVGCLLICMAKKKHWIHPDTNKRMTLQEVVSHLNSIAQEIMVVRPELHITVKGIDYSAS
ncbi:hypothetical protein [Nisaea sp.]|uniref:hypothetical protein n=1 Tax=Nisaea sp. TaxID=2024842 RepID=UPI003298698C